MGTTNWLREDETPQLLHVGTFQLKAGDPFEYPLHRHDDYTELLFIRDGSGTFVIDGKQYQVVPRSMLVYNQGVWHEEHSNRDYRFDAVYLAIRGIRLGELPHNYVTGVLEPAVVAFKEEFFRIDERLRQIIQEFRNDEPESGTAANHQLALLLVDLIRIMRHQKSRSARRNNRSSIVIGIKTHIQNHYREQLTLKALAHTAFTSPYHLCRLFKKETGRSPIQYLIEYRIEVAKYWLTSSNETLGRIAERIGYESETHFQNVFRKLVGIPPGRYRRLHKSEA